MELIEATILNLILMIFPILVYFIYNCYRGLGGEEYNNLLLELSLITSIYLCFRFGDFSNNTLRLLFSSLPIVVAYLNKQTKVAILLSIVIIIYAYFLFEVNPLFLILKFISYYLVCFLGNLKRLKDDKFILLIAILQGFFLSFEYFYSFKNSNIITLFELFIITVLFYILPFVILYLLKFATRITSLFLTILELEKDKQLKNSLFKITHEVKNPIAVCKGYLDMIDTKNTEQVERYIPIIKQEISRSLDIMSDFMEFSKIKIEKEIIDINMLLEDIEEEFQLLINDKDILFECKLIQDEVYVEGDYNRLKQVFINLIKNCLEAIKETGKIQIICHILKGCYYIEIIDNGCGMDSETLSKVKEMFFTTKIKGNGLGVSLSNEIIKAHQGCMDYNSKVGRGTKVIVRLPIVVL